MELAGGEHGATKIFTGALVFIPRRVLWVAALCLALVVLSAGWAEAEQVLASWYGPGFEGQPTASGEPFDKYDFTCAHKTLPLDQVGSCCCAFNGALASGANNPATSTAYETRS